MNNPRCSACEMEKYSKNTVHFLWLEGSNNLVGYLIQLADELKVNLILSVTKDKYSKNLIAYYQKNGFMETSQDDNSIYMERAHKS